MPVEHTERMRVQWVDTDASGLTHYSAALRFFEVPEHALLRARLGERRLLMPRVHVEADYAAPLRYPEEFDCTARVARLGRRSLHWEYEVVRLDGVCAVRGRIVSVLLGADGQPGEIPADVREKLSGP